MSALTVVGCTTPAAVAAGRQAKALTLAGAGSTFDAPFFLRAFYQYGRSHAGVTVDYAAVGSGGGIQQFQHATVSFGASDVPMTDAEVKAAQGGAVLQIPVDLGGVAISYNVPGVTRRLRLTPAVLAGIFLGRITQWDDPSIAALNHGTKLPHLAITVVHRSDSSGTTDIFTHYLAAVSPAWRRGPGVAKTVLWPVGIAGKGSQGVTGLIQEVPGAVGYVELSYAIEDRLAIAAVQNAAGRFVVPSANTVAADAAQKRSVSAANFVIVNEQGAKSYPIAGYSWLLVDKHQSSRPAGQALVALLDWLTGPAQSIAGKLYYVPMPASVQAEAHRLLAEVVGPSGAPLTR